ncbi:MAG: hypothetical protein GF411_17305 [Candidatus Lokiarchaeota archaeon]|nr:hypothetical protein [Candidatus Lokiarchaeota archaeon]
MKSLEYTVNLLPNLVQHTLAGMKIGRYHEILNPKYEDEYEDWIRRDLKVLPDLGKIEGVSSTTWFALLYQIPVYLASDDLASLLDIYDMLTVNPTYEVIRLFLDKQIIIEKFIPESKFHTYLGYSGKPPSPWPEVIQQFSDAVTYTYDSVYRKRWQKISPELEKKAELLSTKYAKRIDWIGWWEERTNIKFPYDTFQIELIDSVRTMGTSLLADRDGFYARTSAEKISNNVSHEIGTHIMYNTHAILSDEVGSLIEEDMERYLRTVEVLSWALNRELHQNNNLEWTMDNAFQWIEVRDEVAAVADEFRKGSFLNALAKGYSVMEV